MRRTAAMLVGGALVCAATLHAQPRPDNAQRSLFGHLRGGLDLMQGDAADVLDDGLSFGGGLTWWPETWPVGLVFELDYAEFDVSNSTIRDINQTLGALGVDGTVDRGDFRSWSFSTSVTWSPSSNGSGFYLIAGIGIHDVEARLAETGLVYCPPLCDPWFWWCVPGGFGEGSVVRASESSTELGWNAGLGWAFQVGYSAQLFLEARYRVIDTSPRRTEIVPLSVGVRF